MNKQYHSINALGLKCNVTSFQQILDEISPNQSLSSNVEEELSSVVSSFIQSLVKESCKLARHRKASTLEPQDIALFLRTQCDMDPSVLSDSHYYTNKIKGKSVDFVENTQQKEEMNNI